MKYRGSLAVVWLVLLFASYVEADELEGTWIGEDHTGEYLCLVFGPESKMQLLDESGKDAFATTMRKSTSQPGNPRPDRLEYYALPNLNPPQLYWKIFQGSKLLEKIPFAIYKIDGDKLTLCDAIGSQTTIGGIPIGEVRYEFPKKFSGNCSVLQRKTVIGKWLDALFGDK